ncbi:MAG: Mur ligase family protein [Patescibacteria group bacterium]
MARSNSLWKAYNAVFPLQDFLYLLQLEEYETDQYIARLQGRWFRRGFEQRDHAKFTARLRVIALVTVLLIAITIGVITAIAPSIMFAVVLAFVVFFATPLFVLLANVALTPLFKIAHDKQNAQARSIREHCPNLRVIAVAGSYGKTTTKNVLYEMIRRHHKTQLIEGNINTTAGIAAWMLKKFEQVTNVLIVEMDAYHPGEIAESCRIVQPSMAILTSIGDQHLMRFGSQQAIVQGLQEVFVETEHDGLRVCSNEVSGILREYGYDHDVHVIPTTSIIYRGETISTDHLSDSVREDAAYAAAIANALDIPPRFVSEAIYSFHLPDRRQRQTEVFGYEGIDDSYNISTATAHAGVMAARELTKKSGKKLVVLTAGIPELPQDISAQENAHYGAFLAAHADAVLVLRSEFCPFVVQGIEKRIPLHTALNLVEAVPLLHKEFPTNEYVLLFQPELTDASY